MEGPFLVRDWSEIKVRLWSGLALSVLDGELMWFETLILPHEGNK